MRESKRYELPVANISLSLSIYLSIYLIFLHFRPYAESFTCSIQMGLIVILGGSIITIPNVNRLTLQFNIY